MTYTFTLQDTPFTQDETFDRLYADTLDDIESGTVIFRTGATDDYKKNRVYNLLTQQGFQNQKFISLSKDSTIIMYIQGWIKNNTLVWNVAITGKINNSKSWLSESAFWTANKNWIQSQDCTAFEVNSIHNSRIETFLTGIDNANKTEGTLSKLNYDDLCVMRWEF